MSNYMDHEIAWAREQLDRLVPVGTRVHYVVRHVSRSGMTRWIDFYVIEGNVPIWITLAVAIVTGGGVERRRNGAMRVQGCGMDMGFKVVYDLAFALHGDGYALTSEVI